MKTGRFLLLLIIVAATLSSCGSIQKKAVRSVADMLSSPDGAGAFTSDDDPQLVGDALPLALKLYEILMGLDPENDTLLIATGKNFIMYSGAFVQMPADMLDDEMWKEADEGRRRSKKLFRRGRDYILAGLEMRHEGFMAALDSGDYDSALAMLEVEDADAVYWAGLSWLGMASTDPFDMELTTTLDRAALLLYRALELDDGIPGLHDVMIQLQVSVPVSILVNMKERSPSISNFIADYYPGVGVDEDARNRAFYHYYRALALSDGAELSPHITMATTISIKDQDVEGFRAYLDQVLSADPEAHPETLLMTVIYQEKAAWLLEHIEDFFLVDF